MLHVISRWYTSDFNVVAINFYVFVPPWHQGVYPGVEEMGVKFV